MNGISSVSFGTQQASCLHPQKTKSLGFGYGSGGSRQPTISEDDYDDVIKKHQPSTPSTPSFEDQVLANQQKMIKMLAVIKSNTRPKDRFEGFDGPST